MPENESNADQVDPEIAKQVTKLIRDHNQALEESRKAARDAADPMDTVTRGIAFLGEAASGVKPLLNKFESSLNQVGVSLSSLTSLTGPQAEAFALLHSEVFKTREEYTRLGHVDMSGLNTWTDQINRLSKVIDTNSIASRLGKEALGDIAGKLGAPHIEIEAAAKKGGAALLEYVKSVAMHADNQMRLNESVVQYAAKTGHLNQLMTLTKGTISGLTDVAQKQVEMFDRVGKSTGITTEQVQEYYSQLGMVPGAMEGLVKSSAGAGNSIDMLTATIRLARGSGMDYKDVVGDMTNAFRQYGIVGEDALKFSARIGEVTQTLGVRMEDVRGALTSATDALK
jgi:hypothetical protein